MLYTYLRRGINCTPLTMRILLTAPAKDSARKAEFFEWNLLLYDHGCLFNGASQTQPLICWMKNSRVIKLHRLIGLMRRWSRRNEMTSRVTRRVDASGNLLEKSSDFL